MDDPNELLRSLGLTQTLEELQAQFKDVDQTGTSFMDFNYDELDQETIRQIESIQVVSSIMRKLVCGLWVNEVILQ